MARIRIGSFNVRNLSHGSGRDLPRIAKMINHYGLDIVALQEVLGEGRIVHSAVGGNLIGSAKGYNDTLIRHLLGQWDSVWLQPAVRGKNEKYLGADRRGEGYALLWRKNKFDIPCQYENNGVFRNRGPVIFSNYHASKDGIRLIRDPLYARLILREKKSAELRILVAHLIYGKPTINTLDDSFSIEDSAVAMRRKEFNTLAGKIYYRVSKDNAVPECTQAYTLLLGDYNLNLESSPAKGAYVPSNAYEQGLAVAFYDDYGNMVDADSAKIKIYTSQSELSTLKSDEPQYANNYDHFSFNDTVKRQIPDLKKIRALHEFVGDADDHDAFDKYKETVSDHVPIIIELNI